MWFLRIEGFVSNTGEMYISAYVISAKHGISNTILFLLDTGASNSFISSRDAQTIGIDLKKLRKSDLALGIGGILQSYILDDVVLITRAEEQGALYTRHFRELRVFVEASLPEETTFSLPSVLGRDFLGEDFSIQVDAKTKKVYLICDHAPTHKMSEKNMRQVFDDSKPDQKAFLDTYSFIGYPVDFIRNLCFYLESRLREFFIKKPAHEREIQDEIEKLLIARNYEYGRENVTFQYGPKRYTPDFNFPREDTVLEAKLCKNANRMKEISEEMLADIAAYSSKYKHQVFIVYDLGVIRHMLQFKREIEKARRNVVIVVIKD